MTHDRFSINMPGIYIFVRFSFSETILCDDGGRREDIESLSDQTYSLLYR